MPVTELPAPGLGAAISPEAWSQFVLEHLSAQSVVLASGATRVTTAQKILHVPRILADGSAGWYSELEEIGPGDPTGDELVLTPKKCGALTTLSDEVVSDSSPSVIDAVGNAMTAAVALKVDRALLGGLGGKEPIGVYGQAGQHVVGVIDIDHLIDAAGLVLDVGGQATVAYINPADHTALQKLKDANERPLLTPDYSGGPSSTVYGLALWPTKGVAAGTALVCDPAQIVVGVRDDPTVAISTDAAFTRDGAVCRVVARVDVGVNDPSGLVSIAATAKTAAQEAKTKR